MPAASSCPVGVYDVRKRFGHVEALRGVTLEARRGEVLVVFGDNGAGKSTLLNVLAGVLRPDDGRVMIDGEVMAGTTIHDVQAKGVQVVYQDLSLAPHLSVLENIYLGHELERRPRLLPVKTLDRSSMARRAHSALEELAIKLPDMRAPVSDLSGGQRQAIAIARAVMWSKIAVLMDEPTAALGTRQSDIVCDTIRATAARGLAAVVISHDIPRMLETADRVVVMRQGQIVLERMASRMTVTHVVAAMVGQEPANESV
jgi:ABC-type sugar transport system ATPase subunit